MSHTTGHIQDAAATPNMATSPAGGSGTPSTASAPSSPYWFFVDDVENAGNDKKMTVLITDDVRAYFIYKSFEELRSAR